MAKLSLSGQQKSLDYIWSWYEDQLISLKNLKQSILSNLQSNTSLPNNVSKFLGFSIEEIHQYFDESEKELEYLVSFNIISATEALLRVDFFKRVFDKDKSELGKEFRTIYNSDPKRISLEIDIIDNWKEKRESLKRYFSDYLGVLRYRHWIAHGRYWNPKLGREYSVFNCYDICFEIFEKPDFF